MEIYFAPEQLDAVRETLGATEVQAARALSRAIARVTASIKSRFGKELARIAQAKYSPFTTARFRTAKRDKGMTGIVWVGLEPLSLSFLKAKAAEGGVVINGTHIPNAFMIDKIGNPKSGRPVFINRKHPLPTGIVESPKKAGFANSDLIRLAQEWSAAGDAKFQEALRVAEERLPIEFEHELSK